MNSLLEVNRSQNPVLLRSNFAFGPLTGQNQGRHFQCVYVSTGSGTWKDIWGYRSRLIKQAENVSDVQVITAEHLLTMEFH